MQLVEVDQYEEEPRETEFRPIIARKSKISLIKVPPWLSRTWESQADGSVIGHLEQDSFTLYPPEEFSEFSSGSTPSGGDSGLATTQRFDIMRRPVESLYSFHSSSSDSSQIVECIEESITIRPMMADTQYRSFLHQRNICGAADSRKHRTEFAMRTSSRQKPPLRPQVDGAITSSLVASSSAPRQNFAPLHGPGSAVAEMKAAAYHARKFGVDDRVKLSGKRSQEDLMQAVHTFLEGKPEGQSYNTILTHLQASKQELDRALALGCDLRPVADTGRQGYFIKKRFKKARIN